MVGQDCMAQSMKTTLTLLLSSIVLAGSGNNMSSELLTNNIPLEQAGLRLVISDGDPSKPGTMLTDKELSTGHHLWWMLHGDSTNPWTSVIFIGMSNSFDLQLRTTNKVLIPKSAKGKSMSAGPQERTNLYSNRFVRRVGAGIQDFPKLDELFLFPSNGLYVLEVRYWLWDSSKNEFRRSQPIRLRVVKPGTNDLHRPNLTP